MGNICTSKEEEYAVDLDLKKDKQRSENVVGLQAAVPTNHTDGNKYDHDRSARSKMPTSNMELQTSDDMLSPASSMGLASPSSLYDQQGPPEKKHRPSDFTKKAGFSPRVQEEDPEYTREVVAKRFRKKIAKYDDLTDPNMDHRTRMS